MFVFLFDKFAGAKKFPLYPALLKAADVLPEQFLPLFEKEGLGEICFARSAQRQESIAPHQEPPPLRQRGVRDVPFPQNGTDHVANARK